MKKETKKQEVVCCCNKIKNKKMYFIFFAVLIGLIIGLYYKYGNIATVNGKGISRISYYKSLEKNDARQLLDQMITEVLIKQEAAKKGLKIEQNVIDEEISKIEEQVVAQGQTLDTLLNLQGMTKKDLEDRISLQKLVEKLSMPITEITQAQIDEFLKTNKSELPTKATKDELQKLAKNELTQQASESAITTWLDGLKNGATIIYK